MNISKYSVIQAVPDPIADERINVGIVVLAPNGVHLRTLRSWRRVESFAQEDTSYIREFLEGFERELNRRGSRPQLEFVEWSHEVDIAEWVTKLTSEAENSIQFTPLQPSLEEPSALLQRLSITFLKEPARSTRDGVDKTQVLSHARQALKTAVVKRLGETEANHLVHTHVDAQGKVRKRLKMDLALMNGQMYSGRQAISFQTLRLSELEQQITSSVLILNDVRENLGGIDLGLIAAPPIQGHRDYSARRSLYEEARASCATIGATLIDESETEDWAAMVTDQYLRTRDFLHASA